MVKVLKDRPNGKYTVNDLLQIMKILRAPGGCPWDRVQTHESIRNNFLEESYEAVDAIDQKDASALCEELGDVLMQVVFHSTLSEEEGSFDFSDVVNGVCEKLVYRHPHVFAGESADTPEQVLDRWDKLKRKEKDQNRASQTLLSVPKAFPSLMRSQKLIRRAQKAGVVCASAEKQPGNPLAGWQPESREEIGQILFSLAEKAGAFGADCEEELNRENDRFIRRFLNAEKQSEESGKPIGDLI